MADLRKDAAEVVARSLQAGRACLTCSFQAEDMVVLHLARQVDPQIPVLFLETGYHFPETYSYRDRMAAEWGLRVINLAARQSVAAQESAFGILHQSDPTRCCHLRKVEPLQEGLAPYEVWLTGLRREQSPTRAGLQVEEVHRTPAGHTLRKVSPLAAWTRRDVWGYARDHSIPLLPLYEQGYISIGCAPCTAKPADPNDPRTARWAGRKLECGIHTFTETAAKG